MFNFFKKSSVSVIETRDFSCKEMAGFTFKYPLFKDWEDIKIDPISSKACNIEFQWSGFSEVPPMSPPELTEPVKPPSVIAEVEMGDSGLKGLNEKVSDVPTPNVQKNPHGILYDILPKSDSSNNKTIRFYTEKFIVTVRFIMPSDEFGFSTEQFFQTVIESFKIL